MPPGNVDGGIDSSPGDAQDARDVRIRDVNTPDRQDVEQPDAGPCNDFPIDPAFYAPTNLGNLAVFYHGNNEATGGGPHELQGFLRYRQAGSGAPTAMEGSCVYYDNRFGTPERATSPDLNVGMATISHNGHSGTYRYDPTIGYTFDTSGLNTFIAPGMPMDFSFTGMGAVAAGMARVTMPPLVTPDMFSGTFADPADPYISRTADTEVSWTRPLDPEGNLVELTLVLRSSDFQHYTFCAVPACRGRHTLPASLMARAFMPGEQILVQVNFIRVASVGPDTRMPALRFAAEAGTSFAPLAR